MLPRFLKRAAVFSSRCVSDADNPRETDPTDRRNKPTEVGCSVRSSGSREAQSARPTGLTQANDAPRKMPKGHLRWRPRCAPSAFAATQAWPALLACRVDIHHHDRWNPSASQSHDTVFSSTKGVLSFSRERRKPLLIYPVFGFCVELLETKSNACLCSPEHCSLHTARQAFMDSMHCSYPRPLIALPCSLLHTTFQQSPLHNT